MASFGNGKSSAALKSPINKDHHTNKTAPQVAPVGGKAGNNGIYIGDFDLKKVSFGELKERSKDSVFPIKYDGQETILKLRLCRNPPDFVKQPFKAGPFVDQNPQSATYGQTKDPKWTSRVDMSNPMVKEKLVGLEKLAITHVLANQDSDAFSKLNVPLKKTIMDPETGDDMQGVGAAVPKFNSNIQYAKDPEKKDMYAPTFKLRVNHEPNERGTGLPFIQKTELIESKGAITKRETGSIDDLQHAQLAFCPTIRVLQGIYCGNLGVGMTVLLDDALIITNKTQSSEKSTDIGDFPEMDETASELNANTDSGEPFSGNYDPSASVPGMEGFSEVAAEA